MIEADIAVVRFSADECRRLSEALRMLPGAVDAFDLSPVADELEAISIGLNSAIEESIEQN